MSHNVFRGLGIALITPFKENGEVDYHALEHLIEYQLEAGADFLCVLTTTGETPCLSIQEKQSISLFVKRILNARTPLLLGMGGNNTQTVVDEIHQTDLSGFDGLLSVCPFYNRPSQEGLYLHFKQIAAASPIPIVLYNVPGRTGVNLLPVTVKRLATDVPSIVAIKEASGNRSQALELLSYDLSDFDVLSGDDSLTVDMMSAGAAGSISVVGNAMPREIGNIVHLALEGRIEEAHEADKTMGNMYDLLFEEGNPTGIKCLLSHMRYIENVLRMPLMPASSDLSEKIELTAKQFGLIK